MLRLSEPDPALRTSYVDALRELDGEGNGHYFAMVHAREPGYAGANFTVDTLQDPDTFTEFCSRTVAMAQPDSPAPLRKSWQVSRLIEIGLATTIGANISPCRDAPSFKSCSSKVWK